MKSPDIDPMRHGVRGYGCNGGISTERGDRAYKGFTLSRANWKRSYRHAQRRRWKAETNRED